MSTIKNKLVLIADDDADDRLLLKDAMTTCNPNIEIRFVEDGVELMDYLLRRNKYADVASAPRPELILLDLNMPKKDGREALAEIKTNRELREIPVIVLTTSNADTDVHATYYLGANSFISKPVSYDALVEAMCTLSKYWLTVVRLP